MTPQERLAIAKADYEEGVKMATQTGYMSAECRFLAATAEATIALADQKLNGRRKLLRRR